MNELINIYIGFIVCEEVAFLSENHSHREVLLRILRVLHLHMLFDIDEKLGGQVEAETNEVLFVQRLEIVDFVLRDVVAVVHGLAEAHQPVNFAELLNEILQADEKEPLIIFA